MNEIAPAHNIGSYVPMVDGPEKYPGAPNTPPI